MRSLSKDQENYKERVLNARKTAGKTQAEIAKQLKIGRDIYSNYEREGRAMPQKHVTKFCEYTGVEEKWLISGKGAMHKNTKYDEEFSEIEKIWDDFHENSQEEPVSFAKDLLRVQKAKDKVRG